VGASTTLSVQVASNPPPSYQWRKDGVDIDGATASTLELSNVQLSDAGDYDVVVSNEEGSVTSGTATLTVDALPDYALWLATNFSESELLDNAVSAPSADPDHDGVNNLIEYALDGDPNDALDAPKPTIEVTEAEWQFTYARPANRTDVMFEVEFSSDLQTWSTTGVTHQQIDSTAEVETWQATVDVSGAPKAFFRLKITLP
jgi:hypothetical protein